MSQAEGLSEELSAVLAQFPGPIAIRPSKWRIAAYFLVILLGPGLAISILSGLPSFLLMGDIYAVLLGLIGLLCGFLLFRDLPRVTLDAEGFGFWSVGGIW